MWRRPPVITASPGRLLKDKTLVTRRRQGRLPIKYEATGKIEARNVFRCPPSFSFSFLTTLRTGTAGSPSA